VAPIAVAGDGENSVVVIMGANNSLLPEHVETARPLIARSRVLLTQLEISPEATAAALRIGREERTLTVLNTAPARPLSELPVDMMCNADILCPNEPELELLTGRAPGAISAQGPAEARRAAEEILSQSEGVQFVVVTRGGEGVMVITAGKGGGKPLCVAIAPTAHVPVDTVGAGDAFMGAFAHFVCALQDQAEAEGGSGSLDSSLVIEACRRANVYAGVSVTRRGTQTSFPERGDPALQGSRLF
jgi:ribokinase